MLIVHFSKTPLVAAPLRICKALSMIEGVTARVVVLDPKGYGNLTFENDLVWAEDKEEVIALTESADVIHLHNYLNLDSQFFAPIDFRKLWNKGVGVVRQFHSNPELISRISGESIPQIMACPIPKLVIAQFQERYYPCAQLVPNIVFDVEQKPEKSTSGNLRVSYSPSNFRPARSSRWDTKGYPETLKMLKRTRRSAGRQQTPFEVDFIEQAPHKECLRRKMLSDIALDDLITGSYHMSTLESLITGNVALTHMDNRVQSAIETITERNDFPALNVRLEEAETILLDLLRQPELVRELGIQSRHWMHEHWHPQKMAAVFFKHYRSILENPQKPFPARFQLSTAADRYANIQLYDAIWKSRQSFWPKEIPKSLLKIKSLASKTARKVHLLKKT